MKKQRKQHRPSRLGQLFSYLPVNTKLLYPIYLANQLHLTEETYESSALPQEWDGLTLAFVSDIHFGPMLSQARADDLVQKVNALQPDLILLGGDYGETTATAIEFFKNTEPFKAKLGVLAAIGNHDLLGTPNEQLALERLMQAKGIRLIINDEYRILGQRSVLRFCSTDDLRHGKPVLSVLKKTIRKQEAFTVYFPHSPDILPHVHECSRCHFDLALCGHTHGGQVAVFGRSLHSSSKYGDRYRSGWKREEGKDIFISNGVGTSLIPVRLGAVPQYHKITLKKKPSHQAE